MYSYRLITPVQVDDLLSDWTKYCRSHDMVLGSALSDETHSIVVYSSSHSCCIHIENPNGSSSSETLTNYLEDYCQRHPHVKVTSVDNEETLILRSQDEDTVGFISE